VSIETTSLGHSVNIDSQLVKDPVSTVNGFMQNNQHQLVTSDQSNGQTHRIQNKDSVTITTVAAGNSIIKPNTYSRKRRPQNKLSIEVKTNNVQTTESSNEQTVFVSDDQLLTLDQNQVYTEANGGQVITVQQTDGQIMQICIPAGVDIDEALQSIYGEENGTLSADQVIVNQEAEMPIQTEEPSFVEIVADGSMEPVTAVDGEQVIFIPMNADGTYALDADSLALLAGRPELPVVSSSCT
jgi:hypothetical protein